MRVSSRACRVSFQRPLQNYCNISREVQWVWPLDDESHPRMSMDVHVCVCVWAYVCVSSVQPCVCSQTPANGFFTRANMHNYRYSVFLWKSIRFDWSEYVTFVMSLRIELCFLSHYVQTIGALCRDGNRKSCCAGILLHMCRQIHAVFDVLTNACVVLNNALLPIIWLT